jgi:hypothetical protein
MKICAIGADLSHVDGWVDGQTDMMKMMVNF